MIHSIITQVEESDRNIYITIEDGSLVSVSYSQGLGDIDLDFLTTHNPGITSFVIRELEKQGDELYSPEFFFPSPYWDEQVKVIDDAISKLVQEQFLAEAQMEKLDSEIQSLLEDQLEIERAISNLRGQIAIIGGTYGI